MAAVGAGSRERERADGRVTRPRRGEGSGKVVPLRKVWVLRLILMSIVDS